jgi:hypothetical protein
MLLKSRDLLLTLLVNPQSAFHNLPRKNVPSNLSRKGIFLNSFNFSQEPNFLILGIFIAARFWEL